MRPKEDVPGEVADSGGVQFAGPLAINRDMLQGSRVYCVGSYGFLRRSGGVDPSRYSEISPHIPLEYSTSIHLPKLPQNMIADL